MKGRFKMRRFLFIATAALALALLPPAPPAAANEMISKDLAMKFANRVLPGAIVSVETRTQDGMTYYDIVIMTTKGDLYDATVNAQTGKVSNIHPHQQ